MAETIVGKGENTAYLSFSLDIFKSLQIVKTGHLMEKVQLDELPARGDV